MLLGIFLLPNFILLEHHHEELFLCKAKNEQHIHQQHHHCTICNFEFSVLYKEFENYYIPLKPTLYNSYNAHHTVFYFSQSHYSFLLRAPPVL